LDAPTLLPVAVAPEITWELTKWSLAGTTPGESTAEAAAIRILGRVTPPAARVSVTDSPVPWRALRIAATEAEGLCCFKRAQAPATWGAAIDVPLMYPYVPPGKEE
jgi:hypothetical protein